MSVEIAKAEDVGTVKRLLQLGRYVYANIADEDIPAVIVRGLTVMGGGRDHPWGTMIVDPEIRPRSLPSDAPNRAQLRAIALRHGPWTEDGVAELTAGLQRLAPANLRPLSIMVYATEPWLQRSLVHAGFERVDTVIYFRLPLQGAGFTFGPSAGNGFFSNRYPAPPDTSSAEHTLPPPDLKVRSATPLDIEELAMLDARAFEPIWHYPAADLVELMVRGRLDVAESAGSLAGYSGLLINGNHEAHLARLAVNPDFQGHGVGRTLLLNAMREAREWRTRFCPQYTNLQ